MKCARIMTPIRRLPLFRYRADVRTLGFVALELGLLAGNWSGTVRHPLTFAASFFFAFVCCIVAHNHMHLPVFRGRGGNRLFQLLLMFGSGQPPTGIVTAHNERHHGDPGRPRGPCLSSALLRTRRPDSERAHR